MPARVRNPSTRREGGVLTPERPEIAVKSGADLAAPGFVKLANPGSSSGKNESLGRSVAPK